MTAGADHDLGRVPDETGPAQVGDGGGGSLGRILVPVGGDGRAASAVAVAAQLSCAAGGTVRLVHVRLFYPPVGIRGPFFPESEEEATGVVCGALADAWARGGKASGDVLEAEQSLLATAITEDAEAWGAGIITLTRRPRRAISRLLTGSVTDEIIRLARCPVLIVRPGPR